MCRYDAMIAETIADHISTGVIFIDDAGLIVFINSRAELLLSVGKDEAVGKRVDMLPLRTPLYKVLSENYRDLPMEISINGAVLLVNGSVVTADDGAFRGELIEVRDITEEKRERRQREEFVAMMTHDLKSPLTVMMGYIQAMKGQMFGEIDPMTLSCVEELDQSSKRLLGMIEDVLDSYRLEVGLLTVSRELSDLKPVLDACCHDVSQEALAQEVDFHSSISEGLPPVLIDRKQILRVFANLLGNALKFTHRGGKISLVAEYTGDLITVSVTDTGIGISEKDQAKIFNKYYRASGAGGYKGTGLGLAISKAIVDAHEGTIEVTSREGAGSRFDVVLPVAHEKPD